jgi:hypothetical protein
VHSDLLSCLRTYPRNRPPRTNRDCLETALDARAKLNLATVCSYETFPSTKILAPKSWHQNLGIARRLAELSLQLPCARESSDGRHSSVVVARICRSCPVSRNQRFAVARGDCLSGQPWFASTLIRGKRKTPQTQRVMRRQSSSPSPRGHSNCTARLACVQEK